MHIRKKVSDNIGRCALAVTRAVKHRNQKSRPLHEKIALLKKDISNAVFHVYGRHENCDEYFCKGPNPGEDDIIGDMGQGSVLQEISHSSNLIGQHAASLLENIDTNVVSVLS